MYRLQVERLDTPTHSRHQQHSKYPHAFAKKTLFRGFIKWGVEYFFQANAICPV